MKMSERLPDHRIVTIPDRRGSLRIDVDQNVDAILQIRQHRFA